MQQASKRASKPMTLAAQLTVTYMKLGICHEGKGRKVGRVLITSLDCYALRWSLEGN